MRKDLLVIGIVMLVGGVVLLVGTLVWFSGIRETAFVVSSINEDELRVYLEEREYQIHASYFVPEEHPPYIRIYDPYGNLVYESILTYEKDYELKFDFEAPNAGVYRIKVENVEEENGILDVRKILYPFTNLITLGAVLTALGIAITVVGVIEPYKEQRSGEVK